MKYINKSNGIRSSVEGEMDFDRENSVNQVYAKFLAAGFSKNSVSPLQGYRITDDKVSVSKTIDDLECVIEWDPAYFEKNDSNINTGYAFSLIGEDEDDYLQNTDLWSVSSCIKAAKIAERFFSEYPCTPKYMKEFADKMGMQYGY